MSKWKMRSFMQISHSLALFFTARLWLLRLPYSRVVQTPGRKLLKVKIMVVRSPRGSTCEWNGECAEIVWMLCHIASCKRQRWEQSRLQEHTLSMGRDAKPDSFILGPTAELLPTSSPRSRQPHISGSYSWRQCGELGFTFSCFTPTSSH